MADFYTIFRREYVREIRRFILLIIRIKGEADKRLAAQYKNSW